MITNKYLQKWSIANSQLLPSFYISWRDERNLKLFKNYSQPKQNIPKPVKTNVEIGMSWEKK